MRAFDTEHHSCYPNWTVHEFYFRKEVMSMRRSSAFAVLAFLVVSVATCAVTVTDVYNAPNPLVTQTTFYLVYYPTPYDFYSVVIKVYNLGGQQVAQPNEQSADSVPWDGKDDDGNDLANGTYLYKAYVYELDQGVPYLLWQSSVKTMSISR